MSKSLAEFNQIVDAEAYFEFFELPYSPQVVNINRLHILRKFSQAIATLNKISPDLNDRDRLVQYRAALEESYSLFLSSTPLEQKLFKVFNQKPQNVVMLREINHI